MAKRAMSDQDGVDAAKRAPRNRCRLDSKTSSSGQKYDERHRERQMARRGRKMDDGE